MISKHNKSYSNGLFFDIESKRIFFQLVETCDVSAKLMESQLQNHAMYYFLHLRGHLESKEFGTMSSRSRGKFYLPRIFDSFRKKNSVDN